jgi:hypothetical protein
MLQNGIVQYELFWWLLSSSKARYLPVPCCMLSQVFCLASFAHLGRQEAGRGRKSTSDSGYAQDEVFCASIIILKFILVVSYINSLFLLLSHIPL